MGRLASTVEMSKSGLFAHFGSKQELQLATVTRAWEIFESQVMPQGAERRVPELLERWLSFYERRVFPGGCFFLVSAVEFAALDGPVRDALASAVERQVESIHAALEDARDRGEIGGARDLRETAFVLHSVLVNANSHFVMNGDASVFDLARGTIGDLLGERLSPRRPALAPPA